MPKGRTTPKINRNILVGETPHERGYIEGSRFQLVALLRHFMSELHFYGVEDKDAPIMKLAQLTREREETVGRLRELCRKLGDNDWTENTWIPDVIENHVYSRRRVGRS